MEGTKAANTQCSWRVLLVRLKHDRWRWWCHIFMWWVSFPVHFIGVCNNDSMVKPLCIIKGSLFLAWRWCIQQGIEQSQNRLKYTTSIPPESHSAISEWRWSFQVVLINIHTRPLFETTCCQSHNHNVSPVNAACYQQCWTSPLTSYTPLNFPGGLRCRTMHGKLQYIV